MNSTFLENILAAKRIRVEAAKNLVSPAEIRNRAAKRRSHMNPNRLSRAIESSQNLNVIAEIKRASPSKGVIDGTIDVVAAARNYELGGACAISVLTEEDFFNGSLEDLREIRQAVSLPILRKDFVIDGFQISEAAEAGADAILLIVAALTPGELAELSHIAADLGLDALVEVHDKAELDIASEMGATLIGINNRSLHTFDVSLDVSRNLIMNKPLGSLVVAESGISTRNEIMELRSLGFDAFLVGETLMRHGDPRAILEAWV